jgi:transcriptional regulator with GAF, ATPase, and Fis domain
MESVERLLNILQPTGETHQTERAPETDPVVRAARSDSTLLLLGETGSGKTQLARKIHEASDRAKYPFVELNCAGLNAALVESELFGHERGSFTGAAARKVGLLEAANGGTVFLDEVGELDLLVQAKLLKVLETHRLRRVGGNAEVSVDFRLMCATHRDLRQEAAAGRFRPDLYFRIHVLQINVAPLRSRPWDIAPLANELLVGLREVTRSPNLRLGDDVAGALLGYSWPGNVRELRNVLERAASLADDGLVSAAHLLRALEASEEPRAAPRPSWPQPSPAESPFDAPTPVPPTNVSLRDTERRVILEAFEKTGRNLSEAARVLSMPRTTLRAKLRRFGVL